MLGYFITISKQFFRSWSSLFVFLFPIMLLIGIGKLLPAGLIVSSSITLAITTAVFFIFGPTLFQIRKTSMMKSMSLTTLTKGKVFGVNIVFVMLISIISIAMILTTSYLLTETIQWLEVDASKIIPGIGSLIRAPIHWDGVGWGALIYGSFLTAAVSFGLIYLAVALTKTTQALYIFMFIYIFGIVMLGNVVIPTFVYNLEDAGRYIAPLRWIFPHFYTNGLISDAFVDPLTRVIWDLGLEADVAMAMEHIGDDAHWARIQEDLLWLETLSQAIKDNPMSGWTEIDNAKWIEYNLSKAMTLPEWLAENPGGTLPDYNDYRNAFVALDNPYKEHVLEVPPAIQHLIEYNPGQTLGDIGGTLGGLGGIIIALPDLAKPLLEQLLGVDLTAEQVEQIGLALQGVGTGLDGILLVIGEGYSIIFPDSLLFPQTNPVQNEWLLDILGGKVQDISEFMNTIDSISSNSREGLLKQLDVLTTQYTQASPWDTTSYEASLNLFLPLAWTAVFTAIGVYKYEWTIR